MIDLPTTLGAIGARIDRRDLDDAAVQHARFVVEGMTNLASEPRLRDRTDDRPDLRDLLDAVRAELAELAPLARGLDETDVHEHLPVHERIIRVERDLRGIIRDTASWNVAAESHSRWMLGRKHADHDLELVVSSTGRPFDLERYVDLARGRVDEYVRR